MSTSRSHFPWHDGAKPLRTEMALWSARLPETRELRPGCKRQEASPWPLTDVPECLLPHMEPQVAPQPWVPVPFVWLVLKLTSSRLPRPVILTAACTAFKCRSPCPSLGSHGQPLWSSGSAGAPLPRFEPLPACPVSWSLTELLSQSCSVPGSLLGTQR